MMTDSEKKKINKKIYLRNYYREHKENWKKGNKYHPNSTKSDIKGFVREYKKIIVEFK
jgi:hypothetical protein